MSKDNFVCEEECFSCKFMLENHYCPYEEEDPLYMAAILYERDMYDKFLQEINPQYT